MQVHLETFEDYFGEERDLADIEPREIENHRVHLFTLPNGIPPSTTAPARAPMSPDDSIG